MSTNNKFVYIAYNKPVGILCTTEKISGNIIDAIKHSKAILPIGRLDKDSEGLILLTDDKSIIHKITHPSFEHEKEYQVTVNLPLRKQFIENLEQGIDIGIGKTKPCKITPVSGTRRVFNIVLKQGLNRQIRRMCNAQNYQVIKLQRTRIMHIELGNLKVGEWRNLTEEELLNLQKAL